MQTPVIKRQMMLSLFLFTFHFMVFYSQVSYIKHEVAVTEIVLNNQTQ